MISIDIPTISQKMMENILEAGIILLLGYILIQIFLRIEKKALVKSKLDESVYTLILRLSRIALWLVLFLTVLAQLKINMAPVITAIGAGGIAIALALKDSLGNVAGGIILMFTRPFVAGDEIEFDGNVGIVDRIDLMTTHLHTYDGKDIIVPNGTVTNSVVINASRRDLRRIGFQFTIRYDEDFSRVKQAILYVVARNPHMLMDPAPYIVIREHIPQGVVVFAGVWAKTEERFLAEEALPLEVQRKFEEEGIEIPYPHMGIHIEKNESDTTL